MRRTYDAVLFDLFGTLVDERGEAVAGAAAVLAALPVGRWAIVTSCPRRLARGLLASARLPAPQVLVCADDVRSGKPSPECYLLAAERLQCEPARCLVVEDSSSGAAAGHAAGTDVVVIARGRPRGTFDATFVADRLDQVRFSVAGETIVLDVDG